MYRHAIFDFDGVLCDSLTAAVRVFNGLRCEFSSLPYVSDRDDMVKVYSGSLKTCLLQWLTEEEHRRFFDRHSALMGQTSYELELFPGVRELLASLAPSMASVVTSAYSDHVRIVLERGGVDPSTLYAVMGREQELTKTEKILQLADQLGLSLAECVYVGDLESDILYCRNVPVDIVMVAYGYHPRWHLQRLEPTYLVDSVSGLRKLLENNVYYSNANTRR